MYVVVFQRMPVVVFQRMVFHEWWCFSVCQVVENAASGGVSAYGFSRVVVFQRGKLARLTGFSTVSLLIEGLRQK